LKETHKHERRPHGNHIGPFYFPFSGGNQVKKANAGRDMTQSWSADNVTLQTEISTV